MYYIHQTCTCRTNTICKIMLLCQHKWKNVVIFNYLKLCDSGEQNWKTEPKWKWYKNGLTTGVV